MFGRKKIKQKQLKRRNRMRRPNVGKLGNKSVTKRSKKSSHTVGLGLVFFLGKKKRRKRDEKGKRRKDKLSQDERRRKII